HRALGELPTKARSVVVLRYFLGWSTDEVSEALDIAPGTVESRLSRALDTLQTKLREEPDER
ncbi:MAG: RNA polymerase sigma factor, partial [Acidimicrobiales bacterium]